MIRVTTATSVIGDDLTILGEKITIVSQNKLHICGNVQGDIHGKQVLVSKGGLVTGTVSAENIEVRGGVRGAIRALTVKLHESAQVEADIEHQSLSISKGAEFNGRIKRAKDANDLVPNLDVETLDNLSGNDSDEASHARPANGEASHESDHPAPSNS